MDLRELYQEVILDHNKNPRNFKPLEQATHRGEGYNPLCGDRVSIFVVLEDDKIKELSFQGSGCAISTASASMMTESLLGNSLTDAKKMFDEFMQMVVEDSGLQNLDSLGKLEVFAGVREFPTRVKCATLVWHTFKAAIDGQSHEATTE